MTRGKTAGKRVRHLLALDAAGAACSVALWRDGCIAAHCLVAMRRGQSEHLVPMIEEVMAAADAPYDSLDALAVTIGPGGFTGVRIGLATARGLALALRRPLIGISNFEAVAAAVPASERAGRSLAVVLDSKRHEVYVQAFAPPEETQRLLAPGAVVPPDELDAWLPAGPVLLAGDAAAVAMAALQAARRDVRLATSPSLADAVQVAILAAARPLPLPDTGMPQPLYLRSPDVTPPPPGKP